MTLLFVMLLLFAANGAPIIAECVFGERWRTPLDGGVRLGDGRPLFGSAKSIRGVIAAVLLCTLIAVLMGYSIGLGAQFGVYAMLGDLFSSFIKRRLGIPSSGKAIGLDQIPESLLPLWMLQEELGITVQEMLLLVAVFFVMEIGLSKLLYRWHIRKRPY